MHHNCCILKKFIDQIGNLEVRNRQDQTGSDRIRQDQKETDRNIQDYIRYRKLLHHNYCIIKKFIYQIGNSEVKENPTEKKVNGHWKKKKKKQFLRPLRIAVKNLSRSKLLSKHNTLYWNKMCFKWILKSYYNSN